MSNYAITSHLTNRTGVHTSQFTKKDDLADLKSGVDRFDIDKLENVASGLSSLKTEDLWNFHVFISTTGIYESRTLIIHISCKCECIFYGRNKFFNRFLYFTILFVNYHSIIDRFLYLLLLDKNWAKQKLLLLKS